MPSLIYSQTAGRWERQGSNPRERLQIKKLWKYAKNNVEAFTNILAELLFADPAINIIHVMLPSSGQEGHDVHNVREEIDFLLSGRILPGGRQMWVPKNISDKVIAIRLCYPVANVEPKRALAPLRKDVMSSFFFLSQNRQPLPLALRGQRARNEEETKKKGGYIPDPHLWVLCYLGKFDTKQEEPSFLVLQRRKTTKNKMCRVLQGKAIPNDAISYQLLAPEKTRWDNVNFVKNFLQNRLPEVYDDARKLQKKCKKFQHDCFQQQTEALSSCLPLAGDARKRFVRLASEASHARIEENEKGKRVVHLHMNAVTAAQLVSSTRGEGSSHVCLIIEDTQALRDQSTWSFDTKYLPDLHLEENAGLVQSVRIFRQGMKSQTEGKPINSWEGLELPGLGPSPWFPGSPLITFCNVNVYAMAEGSSQEAYHKAVTLCCTLFSDPHSRVSLVLDNKCGADAAARTVAAQKENVEIFRASVLMEDKKLKEMKKNMTFRLVQKGADGGDVTLNATLRSSNEPVAGQNLANACVRACSKLSDTDDNKYMAWESVLDEFRPRFKKRADDNDKWMREMQFSALKEGAVDDGWLTALTMVEGNEVVLVRRNPTSLRSTKGAIDLREPVHCADFQPDALAPGPIAPPPSNSLNIATGTKLQDLLQGRLGPGVIHESGLSFILAPLIWWSLAKLHYVPQGSNSPCAVTRYFLPLAENAFLNPDKKLKPGPTKKYAKSGGIWLLLLRRADGFLASSEGRMELLYTFAKLLRHKDCEPPTNSREISSIPLCSLIYLVDEAIAAFVRSLADQYSEKGFHAVRAQILQLRKVLFTFHGFVPLLPMERDEVSVGELSRCGVLPHINATFLRGSGERKRWLESEGSAYKERSGGKQQFYTQQVQDIFVDDLTLIRVLTCPIQPGQEPPRKQSVSTLLNGRRERALRAAFVELHHELQEVEIYSPLKPALAPWIVFMGAYPPAAIGEAASQALHRLSMDKPRWEHEQTLQNKVTERNEFAWREALSGRQNQGYDKIELDDDDDV